jgi:ATP-binding cassette subfamily B protein
MLACRQYRKRQIWTAERLTLTGDLVEKMVGHRTRLAQESRTEWHEAEDKALAHYLEVCRKMDRGVPPLTVVAPRCWLLIGLLGLAPGFYSGDTSAVTLAISFGGMLLAHGALGAMTQSLVYLGAASVAWEQVRLLFNGASRSESPGSPDLGIVCRRPVSKSESEVLLKVQQVAFRHEGRADPVLESCNLQIHQGDRILLEGPSGGGKSTFVAILAGLRQAQSGLVLFRGLDRQALGSRTWRRLIAAAPQFHDNHVLSGTLAFNVLMGRRWPASPEDYVEAERLCREVGLGNLLDRMPAGVFQMVGETGWQLSHGERSRLFLARALLQGTDTLILDETFGALDPESLVETMQCVFRRSPTLVLIAHP